MECKITPHSRNPASSSSPIYPNSVKATLNKKTKMNKINPKITKSKNIMTDNVRINTNKNNNRWVTKSGTATEEIQIQIVGKNKMTQKMTRKSPTYKQGRKPSPREIVTLIACPTSNRMSPWWYHLMSMSKKNPHFPNKEKAILPSKSTCKSPTFPLIKISKSWKRKKYSNFNVRDNKECKTTAEENSIPQKSIHQNKNNHSHNKNLTTTYLPSLIGKLLTEILKIGTA